MKKLLLLLILTLGISQTKLETRVYELDVMINEINLNNFSDVISDNVLNNKKKISNKKSRNNEKKFKYRGKIVSKEELREDLMRSGLRWMAVGNTIQFIGSFTIISNRPNSSSDWWHSHYTYAPIIALGLYCNSVGLRKLKKAWKL